MKLLTTVLAAILLAAACGSDADEDPPASVTPSADIMAAALEQLVTVDHTFGDGPPPFTDYLIQTSLEDGGRALTDEERAGVEAALVPLGEVAWIDDPDEFITDDLRPTLEGGVILGVGEPEIDGDTALVPVSLWCGGLCGTWLTYRVDLVDGEWTVTGIEGPVAVS